MTGQMSHASNPRARKKAREGERRMHAERQQSGQPPMTPEQARARLEEIAPAISQETPRPAEALARQVGVDAQRCLQRALDPARSGHRDWKRIGYGYAIVHLLAVLRQQDPGIADAAAKVITAAWDGAGAAVRLWSLLQELGIDPDEVTRLEAVVAAGEGDQRIVSAPGVPDLVAVGNGPLLDPDCRDGKHTSCLGAPCECPVPGVHATKHEYERTQT